MLSNKETRREDIAAARRLPAAGFESGTVWAASTPLSPPEPNALTITGGQIAYLHSHPDKYSLIRPVMMRTTSIDEFKLWVSVPDQVYCRYPAEMQWEIPEPWDARHTHDHPSAQELIALEKAYYAYIFGNSHLVSSYREVLERRYAPFEAAIYQASSVQIQTHGDLIVQGCAAILAFDELIIEDGGRFILNTPCKASIRRMIKNPASLRKLN